MSEKNLSMGDTKSTEASTSSTSNTGAYSSEQAQNLGTQEGSEQEQLSLVEKTRFGLSSYHESQEETSAEVIPLHAATPVKPTLSPDKIGNSAGALLRYHRERLGYSIQEISVCLKVRTSTVADLENDQLAQETAVNFTTNLLRRYSKLLNLDPNTVINLYMQKVNSIVKISQEKADKSKDTNMQRNVFIIIMILVVAGAGSFFAFLGEDKSSKTVASQEVTGELVPSGADGELVAGMDLPMDKVIASNESTSQEVNTEAEVTGTLDNGEPKQEEKPLTPNTVKAQAQAEALSAQAEAVVESNENQPESLPLNDETIERQKEEAAKLSQAQKEQEQKDALASANGAEQNSQGAQNAQDTQTAETAQNSESKNAQETNESKDKAKAEETQLAQNADQNQAQDKEQDEKPAEAAPTLAKNLKNISSQVKIVDRNNDDFPSLNQVEISVLKDVALEIKGNGKVLKSGVFKSGEKIKLTSIPPFSVSVSDSSAVRIHYLGGVLQTPQGTQVSFELPTK